MAQLESLNRYTGLCSDVSDGRWVKKVEQVTSLLEEHRRSGRVFLGHCRRRILFRGVYLLVILTLAAVYSIAI